MDDGTARESGADTEDRSADGPGGGAGEKTVGGAGGEPGDGSAGGTGCEAAEPSVGRNGPEAAGRAGGGTQADGQAEAKRSRRARSARSARSARRARRARRALLVTALLLLLPLLAAETALRVNYTGTPAPGTRTRHRDALWLGHAWVDGRKTGADVTALAQRLRDTGIRDLYVHAGPLEHDGTLPRSAYPRARWLTAALHDAAPRVRVQAWLGDKLASEGPVGMRLDRPATRAAVLASTSEILATGFQGVHFDLEPLHSGDRDYLALLDDLRALTRARHAVLSVAAHQIDPLPALHSFWGVTTGHPKWWSQAYFGQVARRVDQIAVMSYDTAQPLQSLYGGYVAQQTSLALEVTPSGTDLLMGLPFYHTDNAGHWASAETVPAAVRGVRLGLSRTDADRARFGVALYVDFAATQGDWSAYQKDWVQR
ncbi:glycosyl hydrolase family 18 protein [Streptomyces sp. NK08204]|uniref:glycosyl hydrolase family 18 protein n=1 Tax=Streptomyces sp. NK08204 TaxID=2873260 RepID=UPI001CED3516|nr:glycosyl hydrolase family 18 protein [Streptomyces sp. NK08204]